MWLFLPYGFYSIVDKSPTTTDNIKIYSKEQCLGKFNYSRQKYICVRARDKQSLENLIKKMNDSQFIVEYTDIIDNQGSDYQFRIWVLRDTMAMFVSAYLKDLNYSNFKDKAEHKYHSVFSRVWGVLWDLAKSKKSHNNNQIKLFANEYSEDMTEDDDISWKNWGKRK